jgi:sialic acid synthase SpsE
MADLFGCSVGLSDHTFGIGAAVASIALGACVVEKHFTLARADGGPDAAFSLEEAELKSLVEETLRAWQALGGIQYGPTAGEKDSRRFRRSLYVVHDMRVGEAFGDANVRAIRPGFGLPTREWPHFQGKKAVRDIRRGTPLSWDLLG